MFWEIFAAISSATAVIIAIITFRIDFRRKKKVETIIALNDLFDSYYELGGAKIANDYMKCAEYLGKVDRLAVAVNAKIYSETIVGKRAGAFLCRQYSDFIKKEIERRRELFKRDDYYENIDMMISNFQKAKIGLKTNKK